MKKIKFKNLILMMVIFGTTAFLSTPVFSEEKEGAEVSEVTLKESQIKLIDIKTETVSNDGVAIELVLTGEVSLNKDFLVHIVPNLSGVVQKINKKLGDHVKKGEILAEIGSRELADAKAEYLVAYTKFDLAQSNYNREKELWEKKIGSEKEFLDAKQALAETRIVLLTTGQKLRTFGITKDYLEKNVLTESDETISTYNLLAPIDGTIIEQHISLGEKVSDTDLYLLCNMETVWVICSVYEKDIERIKIGQQANFGVAAYSNRSFSGKVAWLASTIDEETRTMKIRLEVSNADGLLKPGMFTKVALGIEAKPNAITVPLSAIQVHKGEAIVFVASDGGRFSRRVVTLGARTTFKQEVVSGLKAGEKVVTSGSFLLKSELEKAGFEAD